MLLAHELLGPVDAPVVVLIHGITQNRETWRPVADALTTDHRVLLVDLRGHGESPLGDGYDPFNYGTDVVETMSAAGITEPPLVIGHSLGGVVATVVAGMTPTVGVINVDQPLKLGGFKDALTPIEPMLRGSEDEFHTAMRLIFSAFDGALPEAEKQRVAATQRPVQSVVLGTWKAVFESSPEESAAMVAGLLAQVKTPYLAIHGMDTEPSYASWLSENLSGASFELWADHGHYPHLVDTARFLARVADFESAVR